MPSVTMTFHYTGTGGPQSDAFVNDLDGAQCVQLGTPVPTTVLIENLNSDGYNMSDNWRNQFCQVVQFVPQFTIGPAGQVTRSVQGGGVAFGMNVHDVTSTKRIRVSWGGTSTDNPCSHGTRKKGTVPDSVFLDATIIGAFLAPFGSGLAQTFLGSFYGTAYFVEKLCSALPPILPPLGPNPFLEAAATIAQWLDAQAWFYFCECVPGTPPALGPVPPVVVLPPNLPVRPIPSCSNDDLCAAIVAIATKLGILETTINQMNAYITLIQRHGLPFAYIKGRTRSNLSGSSVAFVSRLVGVEIDVTAMPAGLETFTGTPPYITDLGWISALTPDGLLDEIRLTREHMTWFSKLLPTATQIGWGLRDGVIITLTELLPER